MSSNFEDFIRAEMPLRQVLLYQPGDPRTGAGYLAVIGAYYLDTTDNYKRYVKYGGGDTDWELVGNSDVSSSAISALSAAIDNQGVFDTTRIQTLSSDITDHVLENIADVTTLNSQLTSYIQNNNTTVNTLSSDIHTVTSQLTSYIDTTNTVVNNLSGAITNNNSITNINTVLSGLSANFTTNNSTIVDVENRLAQFESAIGSTDLLSEMSVMLSTDSSKLSGTPVSCFDTRTYRAAKYVINVHNYNSYVSFEILMSYFNTSAQGRGIQHVAYAILGDQTLVETTACLIGNDAVLMFKPSQPDIVVNIQRSLLSEQFPTIAYCGTSNIPTTREDIITIHGMGGSYKHYSGEDGMSIQTDLGSATIAVDNISLGGAPWHFRIDLDGNLLSLITIPAKYEGMLAYCKVYVKIGSSLYAGTPDITTGSIILEQQNYPAPTCAPEITPTPTPTPTDMAIECDSC